MRINKIDDTVIHSTTCTEIITLIEEGLSLPKDDDSHVEWQKKCRRFLKYVRKTRAAQKGYRARVSKKRKEIIAKGVM